MDARLWTHGSRGRPRRSVAGVERHDADAPRDPFAGDPADPELLAELAALDPDDDEAVEPLAPHEREGLVVDLEDVEVFAALLGARDVDGIVVDCDDCEEEHYFGWDLLRANLRHLLDAGSPRVHEPAFDPDPTRYVSWDYARGFADGILADADPDDPGA